MPCDQINYISVELSAADEKILADALEASTEIHREGATFFLNRYYPFEIKNGKVVADDSYASAAANAVNRAYSNQVDKVAAKRYGWAVSHEKNDKNDKTNAKITLSKRK